MLGRFEDNSKGQALPQQWQEEVISVLNEAYHQKSEEDSSFFDVYGSINEKEILVIVSYIHKTDQLASPISLFISLDVITDEKQMKKALKNIVDLIGEIFDDIFATTNWNDYCTNWTENKYQGNDFYYKITRENISLTLQANELLSGNLPD